MPTLTVYANANGDGYVRNTDTTWSTCRSATDGNQADASSTTVGTHSYLDTGTYFIFRGFFPFDTSSIPDTATIDSATLSLYESTVNTIQNDDNCFVVIQQSTQNSNTALTTADFDAFSSTELVTRVGYGSITADSYNNFPLNASGLAMVSKTGYTAFCVRSSLDVDNSPPTSGNNQLIFHASDTVGTSQDPKLVVNYTLATTTSTTTSTSTTSTSSSTSTSTSTTTTVTSTSTSTTTTSTSTSTSSSTSTSTTRTTTSTSTTRTTSSTSTTTTSTSTTTTTSTSTSTTTTIPLSFAVDNV